MARNLRPVIAISETTGERRDFASAYAMAKEFQSSHTHILISIAQGSAVKGWKVYDTPDNIRNRIKELEAEIKMLEG